MVEIREYLSDDGSSPFARWFASLNAPAAARIATVLTRLAHGNFSNVKGVGEGVLECRVDFGPGYRIYLGKDGRSLVILLGGGGKARQQRDIATAQARWEDYRRRKRQEG